MTDPVTLRIGRGRDEVSLLGSMASRHGLIAGATGTGKTVTLRVLTEAFSRAGVPVFLADVKGDLSGLAQPAVAQGKVLARAAETRLGDYTPQGCPVVFWDVFGEAGHPARTTVSEFGPLLFARLLNLNETQSGVLSMTFKVADDRGLLLLDLKDLRAMLQFVGEHARELKSEYGNASAASVGAIVRGILTLEEQGAARFFGEPALSLDDLMQTAPDGRGVVNVLAADQLIAQPKLYTTFLLWLISELFESLPEVGDLERPKLVFFFDEAHLLFDDAPKALKERVEQVVRLIRSKGVGIYFVTQNPLDIPETVLGQLGNRVQHALRAFTPKDQKVVRAVAETFRPGPGIAPERVITELAVGEALVSFLDEQGVPRPVDRVLIDPPRSQLPPLDAAARRSVIERSVLFGHYEAAVDRESAYEKLKGRAAGSATSAPAGAPPEASAAPGPVLPSAVGEAIEAFAKSAMRAAGSQIGRQVMRGIFGSMLGGTTRRPARR